MHNNKIKKLLWLFCIFYFYYTIIEKTNHVKAHVLNQEFRNTQKYWLMIEAQRILLRHTWQWHRKINENEYFQMKKNITSLFWASSIRVLRPLLYLFNICAFSMTDFNFFLRCVSCSAQALQTVPFKSSIEKRKKKQKKKTTTKHSLIF